MIKPLILALAAGLLLPAAPLQAEAEITAKDIARHLGIRVWKIPKNELPENFVVFLTEIKDGKEANGRLNGFAASEPGDLTVTVNINADGTYAATLAIGDASLHIHPQKERKVSAATSAMRSDLSTVVLNQPMLLMGDYQEVNGARTFTGKVEGVVSGLALVIVAKEEKARENRPAADSKE